jgi:hypothetical protein
MQSISCCRAWRSHLLFVSVLSRRIFFTWSLGSLHFVLHSLWHTHICWYLSSFSLAGRRASVLFALALWVTGTPCTTSTYIKFCIFNPPSSPSLSIFWTFLSCLSAFLCCQNRAVVHVTFYLLFAAFLSADSFWSGFNSCSHLIFRWCSSHFLDLHILAFWPPEFTFFSKLPKVNFSLHLHWTFCVVLHL